MLRLDQVVVSGDLGVVQITRGQEVRTVHVSISPKGRNLCRQTMLITSFADLVERATRIAGDVQSGEHAIFAMMQHLLSVLPVQQAELLPMTDWTWRIQS